MKLQVSFKNIFQEMDDGAQDMPLQNMTVGGQNMSPQNIYFSGLFLSAGYAEKLQTQELLWKAVLPVVEINLHLQRKSTFLVMYLCQEEGWQLLLPEKFYLRNRTFPPLTFP